MVGLLLGLPHCVYLSNLGQILPFSSVDCSMSNCLNGRWKPHIDQNSTAESPATPRSMTMTWGILSQPQLSIMAKCPIAAWPNRWGIMTQQHQQLHASFSLKTSLEQTSCAAGNAAAPIYSVSRTNSQYPHDSPTPCCRPAGTVPWWPTQASTLAFRGTHLVSADTITGSPGLLWDCGMMFWDLMSRWIMPLAWMWVTADRTSATKCKHLPPGTGFLLQ